MSVSTRPRVAMQFTAVPSRFRRTGRACWSTWNRSGRPKSALLMRFGFAAHREFESPSLRQIKAPFPLIREGAFLSSHLVVGDPDEPDSAYVHPADRQGQCRTDRREARFRGRHTEGRWRTAAVTAHRLRRRPACSDRSRATVFCQSAWSCSGESSTGRVRA